MISRPRLLVAALALAVSVAGCASLDTWQRKAIFQHERATVDPRLAAAAPPPATEAFDLALANGDTIHAWYREAAADAPTVLFLHGARRNLFESQYRIDRLVGLGLNVLAIDYRGFGLSTPMLPSEETALQDAHAALDELQRRQPDPRRRFLYGYSLGGAVAIALAAERDGVAGVVVESSFTSITDLVRASRWGWVPFLDVVVTQEFDSRARIGRVNEPLLLVHGTADGVIPHTMSDELLAAATAVQPGLKRLVKIDGANHRGAPFVDRALFDSALRDFVGEARLAAPVASIPD
ncbi:MAG: alpha/beta hydrolase [Burkholderiaceae bacterium]|nr:alpha/beta hydrolase [Burkholderiaceae bacterium]